MNYKNEYENLKQKLFLAVRKKQGKYCQLQKNGRKKDVIRELISDLDLDDEYWNFLQRESQQGACQRTENGIGDE